MPAAEMPAAARRRFFEILRAERPSPATELAYGNNYQLLVAVILSAQATDVSVNKATKALFEAVKTPAEMLALGENRLAQRIRRIGLFRTKARHVVKMSEQLVRDCGGRVPRSREALQALAGVGRKTANVVLNTAFGRPAIAVDTHIFRVANRTGLAPGKNVRQVEEALLRAVPPAFVRNAHHWLILHGRYRCRAKNPLCAGCPVFGQCGWRGKDKQRLGGAQGAAAVLPPPRRGK